MDISSLEKKRDRILTQLKEEGESNPHVEIYRNKLEELLSNKLNLRDNFINWITGLSTGSMFLSLSSLNSSTTHNVRLILLSSAISSFFGIVFAIKFKVLLDIRFIGLETEVNILKILYEGHDLRARLNSAMNHKSIVNEADENEFLLNMDQSLDLLDPTFQKPSKSQNCKYRLLSFSYWVATGLFILGITLIVLRYIMY